MTDRPDDRDDTVLARRTRFAGAARGQPRLLLHLEGVAFAAIALTAYAATGASWWLFAALILVPDLSMLGYLVDQRAGATIYNLVHTYVGPLALVGLAKLMGLNDLMPYALIWLTHIGIDRALGYGLKYPDGFKFTHIDAPKRVD